jgi:hypothetical protein
MTDRHDALASLRLAAATRAHGSPAVPLGLRLLHGDDDIDAAASDDDAFDAEAPTCPGFEEDALQVVSDTGRSAGLQPEVPGARVP